MLLLSAPSNKRLLSNKHPSLNLENGRLFESLTKHEKAAKDKWSEQQKWYSYSNIWEVNIQEVVLRILAT